MIARGGRGRLLAAVGVALLVATAASAQDEDEDEGLGHSEYARTGFYVGFAGGVAVENTGAGVDDSYAINGWVGYRALPLIGLEGMVEHTTSDDLGGQSGGLESYTWTANLRAYFSNGRIQPFGLVGLGMSFGEEKESSKVGNDADLAMRAGGGVEVHVLDGLSVIVSANYLNSFRANRHLDYMSGTVGVQYQF